MFLKRYAYCEVTYWQNLKLIETKPQKIFFWKFYFFFCWFFFKYSNVKLHRILFIHRDFQNWFFFQEANSSHLGDGSSVAL